MLGLQVFTAKTRESYNLSLDLKNFATLTSTNLKVITEYTTTAITVNIKTIIWLKEV